MLTPLNGKSNISSFMHPGYIQEDPERLIEMENINLNTDVKFKSSPGDLIPTEEKAFKTVHHQELSGAFQEKSPDVLRQANAKLPEEELVRLENKEDTTSPMNNNIKKVSYNEGLNRNQSMSQQESVKDKGPLSCLKNMFIRKKKFEKIRVYFGPNATQDAIYRHPSNNVRTTKSFFLFKAF